MKKLKKFENWVSTYTSNVSDYTNNVNLQKDKSTELSKQDETQDETEDEKYINMILNKLNIKFTYNNSIWTFRHKNWTITIEPHFNGKYDIKYVYDRDVSKYSGYKNKSVDADVIEHKLNLIFNKIDRGGRD